MVEHPAAVVGYYDRIGTGGNGQFRLIRGHDPFEDKCHAGSADNFRQFFQWLGGNRPAHLAQGDQAGGVDIHADGVGAGRLGRVNFFEKFLVFPGFDKGNAMTGGGLYRRAPSFFWHCHEYLSFQSP